MRDGRCLEHARTRTPRVRARARAYVRKEGPVYGWPTRAYPILAEAVGEAWGGGPVGLMGCAVVGLLEGELAELGGQCLLPT